MLSAISAALLGVPTFGDGFMEADTVLLTDGRVLKLSGR